MKITVEKPTRQFLEERKVSSWGIWEKEISRFDWHYDTMKEDLPMIWVGFGRNWGLKRNRLRAR